MDDFPSWPGDFYREQCETATILFDEGKLDECIAEAKSYIADLQLHNHFYIKYCVIIARALDGLDDAEIWRLDGEQTYLKSICKATRENDKTSLEVLSAVREELDELWEIRMEDITGFTWEERKSFYYGLDTEAIEAAAAEEEDEEEDEDEDEDEDTDMSVMDFENSLKAIKADTEIVLPFRTTNENRTTATKEEGSGQPQSLAAADIETDVAFFMSVKEYLPPAEQEHFEGKISLWGKELAKMLATKTVEHGR